MGNIRLFLLSALFLLAAFPLFSRDITVIVIDADLDYPLEGAVIRTRDGVEYICDENGRAVLEIPENRQLILNAFYPGYETGAITIPVTGDTFTIQMHLSGILHGSELVIEASMPNVSETRPGRSIAVTEREISQTGEIGIVEDVMNTIKLLPGVNYSGMFNAQPSIRGGYPGDMSASMDGFTINNPYFWAGGVSIFDPRMVQSAQLSHGVFSSRFGHTISGLLEITTRRPPPTQTLFELGINTSAANFSLSLPFQKGGLIIMGRITYYDPLILLAQGLSDSITFLSAVNYINQAPYIRTATVSGNYRFTDSLELSGTLFWGMDGVGVNYENETRTSVLNSDSVIKMDFANYQGFLTSSLSWNPRTDMLLKFMIGLGYEDTETEGGMTTDIKAKTVVGSYSESADLFSEGKYNFLNYSLINQSDFYFNTQLRTDFDWEITPRILLSAGVQEILNWKEASGDQEVINEVRFSNLPPLQQIAIKSLFPLLNDIWDDENLRVGIPVHYSPDTGNFFLSTSLYALAEYNNDNKLKIELGLRMDHFHLAGNNFSISSDPVLNPRLNIEYNVLRGSGILQSLDLSVGTGLFSTIDSNVYDAEAKFGIEKLEPNRSLTSVLGIRFEFADSLSLNIEGYYKYIFNRMYISMPLTINDMGLEIRPQFDGIGHSWGVDLMLHKVQSRFWDGWISYSFNWTKYNDPGGITGGRGISGGNRGNDWYYPYYHRFHNVNIVANYRPVQFINIYLRFGIASGTQISRRTGNAPISYPVLIYDKDNPAASKFIEKFYWPSVYDDSYRTTPSLPLDLKVSFFGSNPSGRTRWEIYIAVENILAFVSAQGNTSFNQYTGQVDTGSASASYEIPIPIPSFGFKISY